MFNLIHKDAFEGNNFKSLINKTYCWHHTAYYQRNSLDIYFFLQVSLPNFTCPLDSYSNAAYIDVSI